MRGGEGRERRVRSYNAGGGRNSSIPLYMRGYTREVPRAGVWVSENRRASRKGIQEIPKKARKGEKDNEGGGGRYKLWGRLAVDSQKDNR